MGLFFNEETTVETIVTTTTQVNTIRRANWLGIIAVSGLLLLLAKELDRRQTNPQLTNSTHQIGVQNNGGTVIINEPTFNIDSIEETEP